MDLKYAAVSEGSNVIVYGTGASARFFIKHYRSKYNIVAVADDSNQEKSFESIEIVNSTVAKSIPHDAIIVASWAIEAICSRLSSFGFELDKVYWFQHHKNKIVSQDHYEASSKFSCPEKSEILYAFYDLNVSYATFDILAFICQADISRERLGCKSVHFVIVSAEQNDFNEAYKGIVNIEEHAWRKRQMLIQSAALLPTCSGYTMTSCREEARELAASTSNIFPSDYDVDHPEQQWEFNFLFDLTRMGIETSRLRATSQSINYVNQYLQKNNPQSKKVITITLREYDVKCKRNSNIKEWIKFVEYLDFDEYFPVIVPDTEKYFDTELWQGIAHVFSDVCFNVELRMALYELSYLNMGVNNGPLHLCAMSPECRYLMFKLIVNDYPHASEESFIKRGFSIGGSFPGAKPNQKFVWEDDSFEVLKFHFEKFKKSEGLNIL